MREQGQNRPGVENEHLNIWVPNIFQDTYCCSVAQSCLPLCNPMDCSTPGLSVLHHLLKFAQVHVHCIGDAIQPSHHLWCPLLPSVFTSIRNFSESAALIRWPKYWSFSFSISPFNKYSGLISLNIDWFDLLAVQRTLRSLLQHHSSKASILRCSAYFMVWLITILDHCEDHRLHYTDIVGRVMSLLFSTLSRFVIAFLPQSKTSSDFIATVTILSDFRAQEEEICSKTLAGEKCEVGTVTSSYWEA